METLVFYKRTGNDSNGNCKGEIKVYFKYSNDLQIHSAGAHTKEIFPYGNYYSVTCKVVTKWETWEIEKYCKEHKYFYIMED